MRAVVLAYHDVGCAGLQALLDGGDRVVAVYTHADDPIEGGWFGSVADLARSRGVPHVSTADVNLGNELERIRGLEPDILFSFYYRRLVRRELLAIPRLGALNLHGSWLPGYRGRSPVNWVLVQGETRTGVTLHYMTAEPDAGDIVAQRAVPIGFHDTALDLHRKIVREARALLDETLPSIRDGSNERRPQDRARGSYFGRRTSEDGRIDWSRPAVEIHNLVRAVTRPWPGAFTDAFGRRLTIWQARPIDFAGETSPGRVRIEGGRLVVETGQGLLEILRAQLADDRERDGAELADLADLALL
jgi:UDP-4-amino-4-deoxy-L-arabinose formyltransferase / UDP-glucuronic acid dehydrogenase (UDP-4-keto-hexauronic acid decarboxylating)